MNEQPTLDDLGYDRFLNKGITFPQSSDEQTDLEFDQNITSFSGIKVQTNTLPGTSLIDATVVNKKIAPSNRVATAIVSQEANADFGEIQQAIDFVKAQGGGLILVLPGTYKVFANITVPSNIVLEGLVPSTCIIDFNNTTFNLSTESGAVDSRISGLTFQNCRNSVNGTIYLNGASRIEISNNIFSGNKNLADRGFDIFNSNGTSNKILSNTSNNPATFYHGESSQQFNEITGNTINSAIYFVFSGNLSGNAAGNSIYLNNVIKDPKNSIFSGSFPNSQIRGNICISTNRLANPAIDIVDSDNSIISDNTLSVYQTVVQVSSSAGVVIKGNFFLGQSTAGMRGIYLNNVSANCVVSGNYITAAGNSCNGIEINNGGLSNVITGNSIIALSAGTTYAVKITDVASTDNVVVGNYLLGTPSGDTLDNGTSSTIASND